MQLLQIKSIAHLVFLTTKIFNFFMPLDKIFFNLSPSSKYHSQFLLLR